MGHFSNSQLGFGWRPPPLMLRAPSLRSSPISQPSVKDRRSPISHDPADLLNVSRFLPAHKRSCIFQAPPSMPAVSMMPPPALGQPAAGAVISKIETKIEDSKTEAMQVGSCAHESIFQTPTVPRGPSRFCALSSPRLPSADALCRLPAGRWSDERRQWRGEWTHRTVISCCL